MSRRRRWVLYSGVGVTLIAVVGLVLSVRAIMAPSIDRPGKADAVVLLSGDLGERLPEALRLVRSGAAPRLVIDGIPDLQESKALCRSSTEFEVVCLTPTPDNTRNEARAATALAKHRGWRSLIVVTNRVHVTRARMLFRRCMSGSVAVVGIDPPDVGSGALGVAHEWLGTVDALTLARGC